MIEKGMTKKINNGVLLDNQHRPINDEPNPGLNCSGISSKSILSITTAAVTIRAGTTQPTKLYARYFPHWGPDVSLSSVVASFRVLATSNPILSIQKNTAR